MLYSHRLMICRLHGIPAAMTRPDGQTMKFPGCFRCQEIIQDKYTKEDDVPYMNRTELLGRIAALESELLGGRRHLYPKVKKTIAEMIVLILKNHTNEALIKDTRKKVLELCEAFPIYQELED